MKNKNRPLSIIILAAGKGSRMKSDLPKVMHKVAGRPLLCWLVATAETLNPDRIVVVKSPDDTMIADAVAPHQVAVQEVAQGTADAVKAALPSLDNLKGDVLVLYGDGPLYRTETLKALLDTMHQDAGSNMGFLAMRPDDPTGYGRMITDGRGNLKKIIEEKDATDEQRKIDLCWTGIMCARKQDLEKWIAQVSNKNAAKEYYLTDLAVIAAAENNRTVITESPIEETLGANTRTELAYLEKKMQDRLRKTAMDSGVTMIDPDTVYMSWDTHIGQDVMIEPNVFFGPGVWVDNNVHIKAFSHIEGANIKSGSIIGPFARLRPGAELGTGVKIGNFVEVKNATLGDGVKANHHGYIGDADIGAGTNFSCGAITVNYDGKEKHRTTVGKYAMIGSNVSLVAPIEIGEGAYIAAGSTITKDVPADALAVAREKKPTILKGWAKKKK